MHAGSPQPGVRENASLGHTFRVHVRRKACGYTHEQSHGLAVGQSMLHAGSRSDSVTSASTVWAG